MRKWRYKIRSFEIRERWSPKKQTEEIAKLEAELNVMGGEGWELIGVHGFKMVGALGGDKGDAAVTLWKQLDET